MDVVVLEQAERELDELPSREYVAMISAFEKLEALGDLLRFPHSSAVQGAEATLRELRPRAGRGRYRALYRRVGDEMVVGAIAPEAGIDSRGLNRAVAVALERLTLYS